MLSDITDHCIELVFQHSSPITQVVDVDFENDNKTWYQRFAYIKSIIDAEEFHDAVNKVITSPVTKWAENEIDKDVRSIRKLGNKELRQIVSARSRIELPEGHLLKSESLQSIPSKIRTTYKRETVDTLENRFVKHAIQSFLFFVSDFKYKIKEENKTKLEAIKIEKELEQILSHSLFKDILDPTSILLNSPVLQRKEGYREILKAWLMFNLAAKLTWKGGDDVYDIGKRNVALLYEYWLYFQLLNIIEKVFGIKPSKNLIVDTNDKIGLQLIQGKHFPISGICDKYKRKLEIQFSYNRTFFGSAEENNYPSAGSWTRSMRPDYTLSIWPAGMTADIAEKEEIIVHIHFDAKYKIENILSTVGDENLDEEKVEQNKGTYKRADLLKMHAYKDAIRRTGGAYILYPGKEEIIYSRKGFRELIPGLGAFQIRPSKNNDNGSKDIEKFFDDVVSHFLNRASQREKIAFRTYDIHKNNPQKDDEVRDLIPEAFGSKRGFLPDEISILVAFYKNAEHLNWIKTKGLYNFRTGTNKGSLPLGSKETNAVYLLLHSYGESKIVTHLYKLKNKGPKIFSAEDLINKKYPHKPTGKLYIVYELEKEMESEFKNYAWDISKLAGYKSGTSSAIPFSTSLTELMKVLIR